MLIHVSYRMFKVAQIHTSACRRWIIIIWTRKKQNSDIWDTIIYGCGSTEGRQPTVCNIAPKLVSNVQSFSSVMQGVLCIKLCNEIRLGNPFLPSALLFRLLLLHIYYIIARISRIKCLLLERLCASEMKVHYATNYYFLASGTTAPPFFMPKYINAILNHIS